MLLEQQCGQGRVDLFYGDESRVCEEGYVPYGWQFKGEDVFIEAAKGRSINCFALLSRDNKLIYRTTEQSIDAEFIIEELDKLSLDIQKQTVVVLDNAGCAQGTKSTKVLGNMAAKGLVYLILATLFATAQYCRKAVERTEGTVAQAPGLPYCRFLVLPNKTDPGGSREKPVHQLFTIKI